MMFQISGFGDEISPDLDLQLDTLASLGIGYLDLREVWRTPVLELDDKQIGWIDRALHERNIKIASVASPVGKVDVGSPEHPELERLQRAISLAHHFGTPYVRVFSYYVPQENVGDYFETVLWRLQALGEAALQAGDITLLLENEMELYGQTPERSLQLLQALDPAIYRACYDPQNYTTAGFRPQQEAWPLLKPYVGYFHVKDGLVGVAGGVPVGEGESGWPELIKDLADQPETVHLALEPHLASTGPFGGFSGPQLFAEATQALQRLLKG